MVIDASALTSIIVNEDDAETLLSTLLGHPTRMTSPLSIWETTIAATRILRIPISLSHETLSEFLTAMSIEIIPVSADIGRLAILAYDRYGKGRHRAGLNFGDCFPMPAHAITVFPCFTRATTFPKRT